MFILHVIVRFTGLKKDKQLIELQDSGMMRQQQQQQQIQEEADLRALQEQEQAIRQLEVIFCLLC